MLPVPYSPEGSSRFRRIELRIAAGESIIVGGKDVPELVNAKQKRRGKRQSVVFSLRYNADNPRD